MQHNDLSLKAPLLGCLASFLMFLSACTTTEIDQFRQSDN